MAHGPGGPTVIVVAVENRPAAVVLKAIPFLPSRIKANLMRRK